MDKVNTRTSEAGVVIFTPGGVLDFETAPVLSEALFAVLRDGTSRLVVDLAGVETIDSVALGVLIAGLKSARKNGGDLRLASPSERVEKILTLAGLKHIFKSADTAF